MGVSIDEEQMSSDHSAHSARRVEGCWFISWWPVRSLTRNQAITAMMLSDVLAGMPRGREREDRLWPHVEGWARELGLAGSTVLEWAGEAPAWRAGA